MTTPGTTPSSHDDFFIGWLPMPGAYARFLRLSAIACLVLAVGVACLVAARQRDPGPALWDTDHEQIFTGLVLVRPYAMLYVPGPNPGDEPRTMLLVESGKFGALPRVHALLGERSVHAARATGTLLHRDGRWMLELVEGEEGLRPLDDQEARNFSSLPAPESRLLSDQTTLVGEIIDPKCYLGAMKPGGGKTHKACASLCISGGIPPMLVTRDAEKRETFYLLVATDGGQANELVLPFVGDQVAATGSVERLGDLFVLRVEPKGVRRR